jgi:hypothetical protein
MRDPRARRARRHSHSHSFNVVDNHLVNMAGLDGALLRKRTVTPGLAFVSATIRTGNSGE